MVKNFVSVSGISEKDQLSKIYQICVEEKLQFPVVIGYQVSNKSINQGTQNPRQPKLAELKDLAKETREYGLIAAVHYYTKDNNTLVGDLERLAELGVNPSETLVQFNTLPPSLEALKKVRSMGYKSIFKVAVSNKQSPQGGYAVWKGDGVQDVEHGDVTQLVNPVLDRKEIIDYIMFDPSHGTNLDLDLNKNSLAIVFGNNIRTRPELDHLGLVYAGGINPENVGGLIRTLESHFPGRVSIDVESGVRTNNCLDMELVRAYLKNYRDR